MSIPTRAPGKVDRRFIIGVVLVIASVIAFSVLSGFLRGGTRVYTVTTTIAPGDAITADNVRETVLRVDASVYAPTSEAPMGSVATRQLAPGQILMRSDIAQETAESAGDTVRLAVTVTTGLPDEVADGTKIRLWTVPTRTQAQGIAPAREIEGTFTSCARLRRPPHPRRGGDNASRFSPMRSLFRFSWPLKAPRMD